MTTETVLLPTAVVDALKDRYIVVLGMPGVFIQTDMDEIVHVRLNGDLVSILLESHEEFNDH